MKIVPIIWKIAAVALALVVGAVGANQVGWSGAELVVNAPLMGSLENLVTGGVFFLGIVATVGAALVVQRIAKAVLWLMAPILLYSALVLGVWNGVGSDFDAIRLEAIKHRMANAYALEQMSPRARYRSCEDERIKLTEDGKAFCGHVFNVGPGEAIPGSEHRCGFLGMFSCFKFAQAR